jgi:hypothetical protein
MASGRLDDGRHPAGLTIDIDVNSRDAPSSQDDWYLDTERR